MYGASANDGSESWIEISPGGALASISTAKVCFEYLHLKYEAHHAFITYFFVHTLLGYLLICKYTMQIEAMFAANWVMIHTFKERKMSKYNVTSI